MSDAEILRLAQHLLDNCMLSGASRDLCERLIADGPCDSCSDNDEEADEASVQRRKLKELCALHNVEVRR